MATRIYLPSTGSIPSGLSNPNTDTWTETTGFVRRGAVTSRISSAFTDKTQSRTASAANNTWLDTQYCIGPLAGQTYAVSTIKGTIRALESAVNDNVDAMRLSVRVCAPDGTTFRGTIYGPTNGTVAEFNTTLRAKRLAVGGATSQVTITEGDYLVIEIGATATTGGTSISTTINYGDNSATDLGDNETDTVANNPFIELAGNMKFLQRGWGQAQADIKAKGNGLGQAQADIKTQGFGSGQAQTDIKTQGFGLGQAQTQIAPPKVFGQAQALMSVPRRWAQAQALITGTVKASWAQALADVKKTISALGQAQAQISQSKQTGQALATIATPGRAIGFAQGYLAATYTSITDTFTRNTSSIQPIGNLGTNNAGDTYVKTSTLSAGDFVDGSALVLGPNGFGADVSLRKTILPNQSEFSLEFRISEFSNATNTANTFIFYPNASDINTGLSATASITTGGTSPMTVSVTAVNSATSATSTQTSVSRYNDGDIWVVKVKFLRAQNSHTLWIKAWPKNGTEPEWMVSITGLATNYSAGFIKFQHIAQFTSNWMALDNLESHDAPQVQSAQAQAFIAYTRIVDTYTRSLTDSWGSADTGGTYVLNVGAASSLDVNGTEGTAVIVSGAGQLKIHLPQFALKNTAFRIKFKLDRVPTVDTIIFGYITHRIDSSNDYNPQIQIKPDLTMFIEGDKHVGGSGIGIGSSVNSGLTFAANTYYWLYSEVFQEGSNTRLQVKLWQDGNTEPAAFMYSQVDSEVTLQDVTSGIEFSIFAASGSEPTTLVTVDNLNVGWSSWGFGQAQAKISGATSTSQCGQAQADIKATGFGFGQAQADIKQIYFGLGQAQADIKAVGFGSGQANADIKNIATNYSNPYGQAQADIKATGFGSGQAQTDIKAVGFGLGQAQADIKAKNFGLGQAQADIKRANRGFGQAQAKINAFNVNGFGQAKTRIRGDGALVYVKDTFSRNLGTVANPSDFGSPDIGPDYINGITTNQVSFVLNGSTLTASRTGTNAAEFSAASNIDAYNVDISIEFSISTLPTSDFWTLDVYARHNSSLFVVGEVEVNNPAVLATNRLRLFVTGLSNISTDITINANTTYVFRFRVQDASSFAKIWEKGTTEPDWMVSRSDIPATITGGRVEFAPFWSFEPTLSATFDNYNVTEVLNLASAQAQADIKHTYFGSGQAQADIKATSFGLGQAQADIKAKGNGLGQAQCDVNATSFGLGQAQADIKAIGRGFGQSQADIKSVGYGFGQSQSDIKAINYGLGQSQADIKAVGYGSGQCQADIKVNGYGSGQAQTDIKQTYWGLAQAQADIKSQGYGSGQCQARIVQTYFQCAQAQADIKATNYGSGQAQCDVKAIGYGLGQANCDIKASGYGSGQAQCTVRGNAFAQAQADIKATGYGVGQAQCDVKAVGYGSGQSQADIKSVNYGFGQAQCDIKTQGYGFGQAQTDIKTQGYGSGQSQADIKATSYGSGQCQADIKSVGYGSGQAQCTVRGNVFGQAQGDIKTQGYGSGQAQCTVRGNAFGQAQSDIKAINYGWGQAQCDIKTRGNGFGQAQCTVQGNVFGQAQSDIKATNNGFGQAQCDVKAKGYGFGQAACSMGGIGFGYGQAQADIKAKGYGFGQAQCDIKTQGFGSGQAQCDIKQTYSQCAQAQADIKSVGYGFGQAQSDIKAQGYGSGQAQCDVKAKGYGLGQCQADIKQTYQQCAQAQADIKSKGFGLGQAQCYMQAANYASGQAQADIKSVVSSCGQAQCDIKTKGYGFGQAQCAITTIRAGFGQAQADIRAQEYGSGQSNADILATISRVAQAQADILATSTRSGNAQADIKATVNIYAQAQCYIETTASQFGQAQTAITNGGFALGQAQASIYLTLNAFAQAQALILKSAGYAQAQAYIFQPHTFKTLDISDTSIINLTISNEEITGSLLSDIGPEILLTSDSGLTLTISDDSMVVVIDDEA